MVHIEKIIQEHKNKIEQIKNQIKDDTDINQKLTINERILTEQNYLLEIYKIKSTIGKDNKPLKKPKEENKKKNSKKK